MNSRSPRQFDRMQAKKELSHLIAQEAMKYAREKIQSPTRDDYVLIVGAFAKAATFTLDFYSDKFSGQ